MTVDNKTPLLDRIAAIKDLRRIPESDLQRLATELRHETIRAVAKTGGTGTNLGDLAVILFTR
ncbi:MAG: 1-deoxy-D-xylulose-5-phosphate synthase N-terminal domain-containing protein, partial [Candidatus Puniceispirillum sp.]